MSRVLVLTGDEELKKVMEEGLAFFRGDYYSSPGDALSALECQYYPLLVCDSPMGDRDMADFLNEAQNRSNHDAVLLLVSGTPTAGEEELHQAGLVREFLEKPFSPWQFVTAVQKIWSALMEEREFLTREDNETGSRNGGRTGLLGFRGDLADTFRAVKQAAVTGRGLFLTGEPGSGRETLAQVYHKYSPHRRSGLVQLSCAALTGSDRGNSSADGTEMAGDPWEVPQGGILYLEDLDRCPPGVLEGLLGKREGNQRPENQETLNRPALGLVASSRQSLEQLEAEGIVSRRFIEAWMPETVTIPPLRERKRDFSRLLGYFVEKTALELGRVPPRLHRSSIRKLIQYRWPGNVAEMEGVMKRAVVLTDPEADQIPEESFDFLFLGNPLPGGPEYQQAIQILARRLLQGEGSLRDIESHILETVVVLSGGSIVRAVERSGIPKDRFYRYYKKKGSSRP